MAAAQNMTTAKPTLRRQRVAFYLAVVNFLGFFAWSGMRLYFAIVGDSNDDRTFVYKSLALLPVWILSWIISFVIVGNRIANSKHVSSHAVGALFMLAVPAVPVAAFVFIRWRRFLTTS